MATFEIEKAGDLYELNNRLCNTVDAACMNASQTLSGRPCSEAAIAFGELSEAFMLLVKARDKLRSAANMLDDRVLPPNV